MSEYSAGLMGLKGGNVERHFQMIGNNILHNSQYATQMKAIFFLWCQQKIHT